MFVYTKRSNKYPSIEGQTMQQPKEKGQKCKQYNVPLYNTKKANNWIIRASLKLGVNKCSVKVNFKIKKDKILKFVIF